ncbi:MAG: FliA/WhiG family RNA polymerase sigma factor [Candidatus Calescibacterium sp.]|jgi:RNA polymerase sigma factor for flagellar operon FliA|nr:FliA/WhiG family RNA polymerase sigma factor [Candidatus Calescibacterium sp.]
MGRRSQGIKVINKDIRKLVEENLHIVEAVVRKIAPNLPHGVAREEIVSEGIMGLIEAAQKFDSKRGVKFEKWAEIRVRGAIIDYLRRTDIISRPSRLIIKQIAKTIKELQNKLGREPEDEEVAKELGMTLDEYRAELEKISCLSILSLDEVIFDPESKEGKKLYEMITDEHISDPMNFAVNSNLREIIEQALEKLDDKEREVIKMYYLDGFHMKEISKKLKVSESRISQIHSKAILKLRAELEGKINI